MLGAAFHFKFTLKMLFSLKKVKITGKDGKCLHLLPLSRNVFLRGKSANKHQYGAAAIPRKVP